MAGRTGPEGLHTVTPYLVLGDVAGMIEFSRTVFDAEELERSCRVDGSIQHARVRIGDSVLMMGEPEGTTSLMPATLYVYVDNVDATFNRALAAGAKAIREPARQFYGDLNAGVQDANGNQWWMAEHLEDVPPQEKARRVLKHRPPG